MLNMVESSGPEPPAAARKAMRPAEIGDAIRAADDVADYRPMVRVKPITAQAGPQSLDTT